MAKLPRPPGGRQGDLERANRQLEDFATRLSGVFKDWANHTQDARDDAQDIANRIERIAEAASEAGQATAEQAAEVRKLNKELERTSSAWRNIAKFGAGQSFKAFDAFGKTLLSTGFAFFEKGLSSLYDALDRVYELTERWTRLMGDFRNRLGVTTKNLGEMSRTAAKVESTIYGLTGAFGQGAPMVAEFLEGLGRVEDVADPKNLAALVKEGTLASRVLGISAGQAGELARSLQQLGDDAPEQRKLFTAISSGARAAGVSTAKFGKDVAGAHEFMTSFGKSGREAFLGMVTYANRLGVSMRSFQAFTDMTDTFDSATESVAKLNTLFGTTINSLDLVLEDDPSKRLESVRQALLAQGKTYDALSRQERNFISQTMKVTDEELAGVLRTGRSLDDVRRDGEKAAKEQERSQRNMAKLVNKTATTLFSFGSAFDRITVKLVKLIRPFTDMLGLTRENGKEAKSFGQVMSSVFGKIELFIERISSNEDVAQFMRDMAKRTKEFFGWVDRVARSGELQKWISKVVKGAKDFGDLLVSVGKQLYSVFTSGPVKSGFSFILGHVKELIEAWVGLRLAVGGAKTLKMFSDGMGALNALRGGGAGGPGAGAPVSTGPSSGFGRGAARAAGGALLGGAAGAAVGAVTGDLSGAGGTVAAALAGAVGMAFGGPMGAALGGVVAKGLAEAVARGADWLGGRKGRAEEARGAEWQKRYEELKARSKMTGDRSELQNFLGNAGPEYEKRQETLQKLQEAAAKESKKKDDEVLLFRVQKGREAEAVVQKHLAARIRNENVFDRELFELKLRDYVRGKAAEAGYTGDVQDDFEKLMMNGGSAMLDTARGTRQFIDTLLRRFGAPTLSPSGPSAPASAVPVPRSPTRLDAPARGRTAQPEAGSRQRTTDVREDRVIQTNVDVRLDGKKVGSGVVRHLISREPA